MILINLGLLRFGMKNYLNDLMRIVKNTLVKKEKSYDYA